MTYEEILKTLNGYEPAGQLKGFPIEIIARMCYNQTEQDNPFNLKIFEKYISVGKQGEGFTWSDTIEGQPFWDKVINYKKFNVYFSKYPHKPIKKVQVSLMEIADWKECEVDDIEIIN